MPTYEYRCNDCGHELEAYQPITAKPLKKCPACNTMKLARLISGGGAVLFKGGGFYETDYRSESYKNAEKAERDAASPKTDKKEPCSTSCACAPDSAPAAKPKQDNEPIGKKAAGKNPAAKTARTPSAAATRQKPSGARA